MRESLESKKKRVQKIIRRLRKIYPDVKCALDHDGPWQLLVATILSAQCTDKRVNMVTPALFKKFPTVYDFAEADLHEVEDKIKSTGFYKNKAKNIIGAAQKIVELHGGEVPSNMEALVKLPGTGRKTANVVLGNAFGIPGMPVDTHMLRINSLLCLSKQTDAVKMESDLTKLVPHKDWTDYSHLIIHHGRARCVARRPDCPQCEIKEHCPSRFA